MSKKELKYKSQFECLFKHYFNPLFNFVNAQIKDEEESREIVQSSFLKIWNSRGKVDYGSPIIKTYLYTTTKNSLIDHVRKKQRQGFTAVDIDLVEAQVQNIEQKHLDTQLIRNEIIKAMETLKPRTQEIFRMNKLEGLKYQEIADHLGISKRAVEDNIARAIIKLRNVLKEKKELFF